jgi:hypothetical protein
MFSYRLIRPIFTALVWRVRCKSMMRQVLTLLVDLIFINIGCNDISLQLCFPSSLNQPLVKCLNRCCTVLGVGTPVEHKHRYAYSEYRECCSPGAPSTNTWALKRPHLLGVPAIEIYESSLQSETVIYRALQVRPSCSRHSFAVLRKCSLPAFRLDFGMSSCPTFFS